MDGENGAQGSQRPADEQDYYCPGCGKRSGYQRECVGTPTAPHPAIEVVSTSELYTGSVEDHTPAPSTENIL